MNRRELIRRGPMALLGIVAVATGVEAETETKPRQLVIQIRPNDNNFRDAVVKVVTDEMRASGPIRDAIYGSMTFGGR